MSSIRMMTTFGRPFDCGAARMEVRSISAATQASAGVERSLKEFICLICVELCVNAVLRKTLPRGFAHLRLFEQGSDITICNTVGSTKLPATGSRAPVALKG